MNRPFSRHLVLVALLAAGSVEAADPDSTGLTVPRVAPDAVQSPPAHDRGPGWEFEFGARGGFSAGAFQWNIPADRPKAGQNPDISRLTYRGLTGYAGESLQRIDSPYGVFIKGHVGLGSVRDGRHNDEDWQLSATVPYSNTRSSINHGKRGYASVDVGYDVLRKAGYKIGPFVGYSVLAERWDTYGCDQLVSGVFVCSPPVPTTRLIGTQEATWQSLRAGLAGDITLVDRVRLSGDAAYLPYVSMIGRDNHLLRTSSTFFDQRGTGRGVQLEVSLSYLVTGRFALGVGGRSSTMRTTRGTDTCTGCAGAGLVSPADPARFEAERHGVFLQGVYRFGLPDAGITK